MISLKKLRYFIFVLSFLLFALFAALFFMFRWLSHPLPVPEEHRIVTITKGQSLYSLADSLNEKQLLNFPKLWVYYARFVDETQIKAGEYSLGDYESPLSLIDKFESANVIQHKITLIEGSTVSDVIRLLSQEKRLIKKIPDAFDISMAQELNLGVEHLEGWLYPDTYYYATGDTDLSILRRAYKRMRNVLNEEWEKRSPGLPLKTPYEALILASIIEKETGAPHERPDIAGVFIRRLNLGMRLGTDPTVIYGMGESYDGNITRADLRRPTAYNTYTMKGLPPTPIALAGRAAIHAALNPSDGESLYFVAKGDGTHYFSKTLEEHQEAVRQYQLSRKKNYRSNYKSE